MMTACEISTRLRGRIVGHGQYLCHCPVPTHGKQRGDRNASLSLADGDDGRLLFHCHAGCDPSDVLYELRQQRLVEENHNSTYWRDTRRRWRAPPTKLPQEPNRVAIALWEAAQPATGTLVETYVASRKLHLPLPPTLRFHPALKHSTGSMWPAMIALVTRGTDDKPLAIHRTFLARDGSGKAPVLPQRMMLGPCRGGAVRLGNPADVLMVGEGIESCLAAIQATGRPAWAALSTSGLRTLELPVEVRDVIVLADADYPGEVAARDAALRWKREDRRVRIARPPRGMDFNDLLLGRPSPIEEGPA
jgi:hypothetical protein